MSALPEPLSRKLRALGVGVAAATCLCGPLFAAAADTTPANSSKGNFEAVEGRVIDVEGQPIAGAAVVIVGIQTLRRIQCDYPNGAEGCLDHLLADGVARAHGVSGDDGRFSLQIPGGLKYDDMVWAEDKDARGGCFRTTWQVGPDRALPTATLGDIRLNQRLDFNIMVQGDGKPLAGAQVNFLFVKPQRTDATGSTSRCIDATGYPHMRGPLYIMVHADGFATALSNDSLPPGTNTQVVDLVRDSPLTGRIKDARGQPLAQATLKAIFFPDPPDFRFGLDPIVSTARTDDTGAFTLHGLRAGLQYRLIIESDNLAVANGERTITAGSGPVDIVMNAAVSVTLDISGLRSPFPAGAQSAAMPKVPAVISRRTRDNVEMNMNFIERALVKQPDLVAGLYAGSSGIPVVIRMEWLDPAGAWVPVFAPRHAKAESPTRAQLRFDQVPEGTIRIWTTGEFGNAVEMFGPVTVKAGVSAVIRVRATKLR